jgi:outer membrane cobalamin receptor
MNIRIRKLVAALCLFMGAGAVTAVMAQTTTAAQKPGDEKVTLEEFVVTGSLIPYAAAGVQASPVKVMDAGEIEKTGISTDLADILRRSQPAFYGANNLGSTLPIPTRATASAAPAFRCAIGRRWS